MKSPNASLARVATVVACGVLSVLASRDVQAQAAVR